MLPKSAIKLFGDELSVPFLLAPIGAQGIIHENGDLASARAAASTGVPFIQSTQASYSLEDISASMGETPHWFQLYWSADRDVTASLVDRAESAGYSALVVTVDTPQLGWRERDVERGYLPFLNGKGLANYFTDPAFRSKLDQPPEENEQGAVMQFIETFSDPALTWSDFAWLRSRTDLPIIIKGVLHPEDAELAVEHGIDGLIVSNHGGRQVDGAVGAMNVLPAVVERIDGRIPVLFDSGVRRGSDVIKAIALGAEAVLLGRPYVYGLALGGESGVKAVIENLRADVDLTLALAGHDTLRDIDGSILSSPYQP